MKRLFDFAVALVALSLLAPLLLAIALAVVLDSRGGVFFRQDRVGRHERLFRIFKFRSMVSGAERLGPYFTESADRRITTVGRFLRRTSLDELPQLLNVLRGEMSLVGPRPDVPQQRELYTESEWRTRHTVRPGITGLAQATLRSAATLEQRKSLDLQYVRHPTFLADMKIIFLTVGQVIGRGGN